MVDLNLDTFFNRVKNVCKNNKLTEFHFKLLHRILVTKKELSFYGIESDMLCFLCQEPDSISHTFQNCHWSKHFFDSLKSSSGAIKKMAPLSRLLLLKYCLVWSKGLPPSRKQVNKKFNYTLLFAKYCLYTQKLLKKEINMKEFIRKLTSKLQIEKLS